MNIFTQLAILATTSILGRKIFKSSKVSNKGEDTKEEQEQVETQDQIHSSETTSQKPSQIKANEIKKQTEEIEAMKIESEQYNNTDSYVKYSKLQRTILKMSKELEKSQEILKELIEQEKNMPQLEEEKYIPQLQQDKKVFIPPPKPQLKVSQIKSDTNELIQSLKKNYQIILKFFPITINADINTLWPLSHIIATPESETTAIISTTVWIFVAHKALSVFTSTIENLFCPKNNEEQEKQKAD